MTIKGTKQADSLAQRIERFYAANPHELLTWGDAAIKFGCTRRQARNAVVYLQRVSRLGLEVVSVIRIKEKVAEE